MISQETVEEIRTFSRERDWDQFHTPSALARSICIEAAELLECFQWDDAPREGNWEAVNEELADVLTYCLMMADSLGVDADEIVRSKLEKTRKKYPASKVRGSNKKYTEYE